MRGCARQEFYKKSKPLSKGAALKSAGNEKGLWLYGFAARMVRRVSVSRLVSSYGFVRRKLFTIRAAKTYNFKPFKKLSRLAAVAIASIAIIGIVVFFQFAPENAQAKI